MLIKEVRYLLNIHGHDLEETMNFKVKRTDGIIKDFKKGSGNYISCESLESMIKQLRANMTTWDDVTHVNNFLDYVRSFSNGEFNKSSDTL